MSREEREKKVSAARRAAEQEKQGFESTVLRLPEGLGFFEMKPGVYLVDVVPYKVKKGSETPGGNPQEIKGNLFYKRVFYTYRKVGPDEKSYVALGLTFGKPDPVAEMVRDVALNKSSTDTEKAYAKSFEKPKKRELYLLWDRKDRDKGVQLLEVSHHLFGKLLNSRVLNSSEEEGWDLFYFPDEDGMSLRLTVEEVKSDGYTYNEVTAIDFVPRKEPLPDKIVNHGIDLDDLLVEQEYSRMKKILHGLPVDADDDAPAKSKTGAKKSPPKDDDEEDEKPAKKKETKEEPEKKKTEPKAEKKEKAPEYKKGDPVFCNGKPYSILKINMESGMATIIGDDDEPIRVEVDELSPVKTSKSREEPEKKKTILTAAEAGIENGCKVIFNNLEYEVFRISNDGTSLTLLDEDGYIEKAIGCADVKLKSSKTKEEKKTEPKAEKKEKAAEKTKVDPDDDDDDWEQAFRDD